MVFIELDVIFMMVDVKRWGDEIVFYYGRVGCMDYGKGLVVVF